MNQKSSKVAMDNLPFIDKFIYISIKSSIDRGLFYGSWWPPDFIDFMIRGRRRGISAPLRILASLKHDETSKLPPNLMVYDACYHVPLYFLCIFVGYSIRWPVFTVCLPCVYRVFTVCLPCVQGIPKQAKSWSSSAAWKASSRACDAMSIVELNGAHSGTYPHHFAEPHKSWFKHIFPHDYSLVSPSIWGWVKTLSPWWTSP